MKCYLVQVYLEPVDKWMDVAGTTDNLSYCRGYVDAMDSLHPSRPHRIKCLSDGRIVRETKGRSKPQVNCG